MHWAASVEQPFFSDFSGLRRRETEFFLGLFGLGTQYIVPPPGDFQKG